VKRKRRGAGDEHGQQYPERERQWRRRDAGASERRGAARRANLDRELDVERAALAVIAAIIAVALLGVATAVAGPDNVKLALTADARAASAVEAARD